MKNNTIKFLTFGLALFLVSCSNSTEPVVEESQGPIYRGPYHIEFLACNAGPDYSSENAQKMLAEEGARLQRI